MKSLENRPFCHKRSRLHTLFVTNLLSIICSFSLIFLVGSPVFASSFTYSEAWGNEADDPSMFRTPVAMAKDLTGNIYVADMGNHRIVKMNKSGKVLETFGGLGDKPGKFNMPFGVAIKKEGNILVGDTGNYRIQKFDHQFHFLKSWGTRGKGEGEFGFPRELAVDSKNNYYVTDEYNHRIQKFDQAGAYLLTIGTYGKGQGELALPQGIAISPTDDLIIEYRCLMIKESSKDRLEKVNLVLDPANLIFREASISILYQVHSTWQIPLTIGS